MVLDKLEEENYLDDPEGLWNLGRNWLQAGRSGSPKFVLPKERSTFTV